MHMSHVKLFVTLGSVVAAKAHGCTLGSIGCARRVLRQGADTQLPLGQHWKCNNDIGRKKRWPDNGKGSTGASSVLQSAAALC